LGQANVTAGSITHARSTELLELAEAADAALNGPTYDSYRPQLEGRADDFADAVRHYIEIGDHDAALRLVAALRAVWQDQGRADRGRRLTDLALREAPADAPSRAGALLAAGELAFRQGDQEGARRLIAESLTAAQRRGDQRTAGLALVSMARIAFRDGDAAEIERYSQEALNVAPENLNVRRGSLHMQAWAAHTAGDLPRAISLFEKSMAFRREMGDPFGVAVELGNLGDMALEQGNVDAASGNLNESLRLARERDTQYLLLGGLLTAVRLAARRGDLASAVRLEAAMRAGYQQAGLSPDPGSEGGIHAILKDARTTLGPGFARAQAEGVSMSVGAAVDEVLAWDPAAAGGRRTPTSPP
jgi:tetratricopeptide (TPR) repeat protein